MLEYPRWKYILVSLVLVLAFFLALPNIFPSDFAVHVARADRALGHGPQQTTVEGFLKEQRIDNLGAYLDNGRLMIRFAGQAQQYQARDAIAKQFDKTYVTALAFAPRTPNWLRALGLRPMPLGLDLRGG